MERMDWEQRFPQLHAQLTDAIRELGGKVAPKLNWSTPSDATWVNPLATLACTNADEVGATSEAHYPHPYPLQHLFASHLCVFTVESSFMLARVLCECWGEGECVTHHVCAPKEAFP